MVDIRATVKHVYNFRATVKMKNGDTKAVLCVMKLTASKPIYHVATDSKDIVPMEI